jgi:hypothetical protein
MLTKLGARSFFFVIACYQLRSLLRDYSRVGLVRVPLVGGAFSGSAT